MEDKIQEYGVKLSRKGRQNKEMALMFGYGRTLFVNGIDKESAKLNALKKINKVAEFGCLSNLKAYIA